MNAHENDGEGEEEADASVDALQEADTSVEYLQEEVPTERNRILSFSVEVERREEPTKGVFLASERGCSRGEICLPFPSVL